MYAMKVLKQKNVLDPIPDFLEKKDVVSKKVMEVRG